MEYGVGEVVIVEVIEKFGGFDILLYVVGINDWCLIFVFIEEEWECVMWINFFIFFGFV